MEVFLFWIILILIAIFVIAVPILFSIFIFNQLGKNGVKSKWRYIAFLPILVMSWVIFKSVFPTEDFYQDDFKEVTGINLPDTAEIEFKTASFPDHFGDYTSVSIIKVNEDFYHELPSTLKKRGLIENKNLIGSIELNQALEKLKGKEIVRQFSLEEEGGRYYYVGLVSDNKTIVIERISW